MIRCSPALVTSKRLTVTRISERSRAEMSQRVPDSFRSMVMSVPSSTSISPRSVRVLSYKNSMGIAWNSWVTVRPLLRST